MSDSPIPPGDPSDPVMQQVVDAQRDAVAMALAARQGDLRGALTVFNCSERKEALVWAMARLPGLLCQGLGVSPEGFAEQCRELLDGLPHTVADVDDLIDNPESEEDDR